MEGLLRDSKPSRGPGSGLLRPLRQAEQPQRASEGLRGHVQVVGHRLALQEVEELRVWFVTPE